MSAPPQPGPDADDDVAGLARVAQGYFFLLMLGYYVLKPIRESLFLGSHGSANLPVAHLGVLAVTLFAFRIYAGWVRTLPGPAAVRLVNGGFLSCIVGFWIVAMVVGEDPVVRPVLAGAYFVWASLFSTFATSLFWALCSARFTPAQGSRHYGRIAAAGILGAMAGGLLTRLLAQRIGTLQLLLLAAVLLSPLLGLGARLVRGTAPLATAGGARKGDGAGSTDALARTTRDPYLVDLALLVVLTILATALDDYRCVRVIEAAVAEQDARTAFFGSLYFTTNLVGVVLGGIVAGPVQMRWGPLPGLALHSLLLVLGAGLVHGSPTLGVVYFDLAAHMAVSYSIFQSSRELLFVPCEPEARMVFKGLVDTFCFRLGGALAACFMLLLDPARALVPLSVAIAVAASAKLLLSVRLARAYAARIRASGGGSTLGVEVRRP